MNVVRRLLTDQIEQVWGAGRTELVWNNYAPDVVDHMPAPGQHRGLAALADVVTAFREGLPDMRLTLDGTIVAGDMGADWWTLTGTHTGPLFGQRATGRQVCFRGADMVRVDRDKIVELWHVEDMARFEDQLAGRTSHDAARDRAALQQALTLAASNVEYAVHALLEEAGRAAERWSITGQRSDGTHFAIDGFDVREGGTTLLHVAGPSGISFAT